VSDDAFLVAVATELLSIGLNWIVPNAAATYIIFDVVDHVSSVGR
jgi:hypothetical protein